MITESNQFHVIQERDWLMQGQPTRVAFQDEYNRTQYRYTPTQPPMGPVEAHRTAVERAASGSFQCPYDVTGDLKA